MPTSFEFRLRRIARRARRGTELPYDHAVHACVWKTGSQWLKLVISDPRLNRYHDLQPHLPRELPVRAFGPFGKERHLLVPAYMRPYEHLALDGLDRARALFVFREPVDQFVSWYISTRYTHIENAEIRRQRQQMARYDDHAAARWLLEADYGSTVELYRSWSSAPANDVLPVSFDQVTKNQTATLDRIFQHLDWNVPRATTEGIVGTYTKSRMARVGGRIDAKYSDTRDMRSLLLDGGIAEAVAQRWPEIDAAYALLAERESNNSR